MHLILWQASHTGLRLVSVIQLQTNRYMEPFSEPLDRTSSPSFDYKTHIWQYHNLQVISPEWRLQIRTVQWQTTGWERIKQQVQVTPNLVDAATNRPNILLCKRKTQLPIFFFLSYLRTKQVSLTMIFPVTDWLNHLPVLWIIKTEQNSTQKSFEAIFSVPVLKFLCFVVRAEWSGQYWTR